MARVLTLEEHLHDRLTESITAWVNRDIKLDEKELSEFHRLLIHALADT